MSRCSAIALAALVALPAHAGTASDAATVLVGATLTSGASVDLHDEWVRAEVWGMAATEVDGIVTLDTPTGTVDLGAFAGRWVPLGDPGLPAEVRAVAELRAREDAERVPLVRVDRRRGGP